ncbi:thioredoxin-disulfide reductase [Patescibacteria group bacterium]|nr:thioredoxin-disulfide reductase [Patescibacteria group bacterium]
MENVIIIGSGPAGMTAAIYAARADLNPLVAGGIQWGGLLMWTTEVENFPGFPGGIIGPELMSNMKKQAERFGAKFEFKDVTEVDFGSQPLKVKIAEQWHETKAVIVAAGTKPRTLKLPREKELIGRGLSVCATCDGAFFKDKEVIVLGGGDSAMEEATFLTKFAKRVRILMRGDEVRASKIMYQKAKDDPKIEIMFNTEVTEYLGDKLLEGVKIINNKTKEEGELEAQGLFFAIGHVPASKVFGNQLPTDEKGYLLKKEWSMSEVAGVFIAGDIEDWRYRQAVTAAGAGCMAAIDATRWLHQNGE